VQGPGGGGWGLSWGGVIIESAVARGERREALLRHRNDRVREGTGVEKPIQRSPRATGRVGATNALMWLRPLVRQLRTDPELLTPGEASLLLEFDVDGAQCLLIERRSPAPEHGLSTREQEIASMVAQGHPDKSIAAELGISRWTVSTHLRRIYVKLGVHSRAAMVAKLADERLAWPELVSGSSDHDGQALGPP